jgi:cobalt-zinc-cadmium efflux system outer membrane protein
MRSEFCLTTVVGLWMIGSVAFADDAPRELSLREAIDLALETSPRLEALRAELESAEAELTRAKTYPHNPVVVVELGDRDSASGSSTDALVGASQEIEIRGQRGKRVDATELARDAARLRFERERKLLVARVSLAFVGALERRELWNVQSDDAELADDLVSLSASRLRAGKISALEASFPRVSLGRAEAEEEMTRALYGVSQAMLAEAVGMTGDGLAVPRDELALPRREENLSPDELVSAALQRREDLLAYRELILAAEARWELARAQTFSRLNVGAFYKKEERTDTIVGGTLRFDLPIFERNQGGIEAAQAELRKARAEAEGYALVVREEVLSAHARFLASVAAVGHLEESVVGNLEDNVSLLRVAYEAGKIDLGEVVVFRRELVEARRDYVQAVAEAWRAAIVLDLAAGRVPVLEGIPLGNMEN